MDEPSLKGTVVFFFSGSLHAHVPCDMLCCSHGRVFVSDWWLLRSWKDSLVLSFYCGWVGGCGGWSQWREEEDGSGGALVFNFVVSHTHSSLSPFFSLVLALLPCVHPSPISSFLSRGREDAREKRSEREPEPSWKVAADL